MYTINTSINYVRLFYYISLWESLYTSQKYCQATSFVMQLVLLLSNSRTFLLNCAASVSPWWSLSSTQSAKQRDWTSSCISRAEARSRCSFRCVSSGSYLAEGNPCSRKSRRTAACYESPTIKNWNR